MTKVMVSNFGWVYIVIVLDWFAKKIIGHYAGIQCKAEHWLNALDMAVQREFPEGVCDKELNLMSDNGCKPTSERFMRDCSAMRIHQAFTSYNNPKCNADTERLMRTLKEELIWLKEWDSPFELGKELDKWVRYYNNEYLHSSLGYKSPAQFEKKFKENRFTLLTHA